MKKLLLPFITVLIIGTVVGIVTLHHAPATTPTTTAKKAQVPRRVAPITASAVAKDPKLKYSCIIYYAVKHLKIQRWQEVSDFKLGWQVEIYHEASQSKYLVWPDKNIKTSAKALQPNWFTIKNGQVTYDSFGVHTFKKDMTATVSLTTIIKQIQQDHATKTVRNMRPNLVVKEHAHADD
ncbi:hypothetical protein [Lactiplantibacillus pentosus]|uniref:hypothetical protein n=1 Tax=Lactiplantibacillus pentosus TaxID=1589 RepID=UPI001FD6E189|nr:hypothetical protein [Lactiplantibacillus pentosus]MCJ8181849.1 hypothetical protein [Lactiplantibacillus pentosus]